MLNQATSNKKIHVCQVVNACRYVIVNLCIVGVSSATANHVYLYTPVCLLYASLQY